MTEEYQRTAVRNLQSYLRQLSYHDRSITAPPIDGIFEADTRRALREFQETRSLPVTGVADRRTWDALYAAYRASLNQATPPREVAVLPFLAEEIALSVGSEGFAVTVLQHMLRELSESHAEWADIAVSGVFDGETANAVRSFQKKNALQPSGNVDLSTWNNIADQYNILLATQQYP